ncbi:hypothetical protein [Kozakia baliensis]|uniref:Uncharacterized protein n=1 Tax=Kozakia baliensis TaxID=153496 RepID=A0A1D8UXW1_9PROT|nr:hypothetical protein [Kozakia baliensis]AOX18436.1 hypothetical protein A0U89_14060 [Kozakia baliensis]AOX18662.1 hypothetical protein A0U89_15240 [Kozakia baliensis]GEL65729.1 hypothetical protein KBA01_30150 [Kozakia baliensis]
MFSLCVAFAAVDRVILPWTGNETVGPSARALKNCVRRSFYGPSYDSALTLDGHCPYRDWSHALDVLATKSKTGSRREKMIVAAFLQDVKDYLPAEIDGDLPSNWSYISARTRKMRTVA